MNPILTSSDINTEEALLSLLSPITNPEVIFSMGNGYNDKELTQFFSWDESQKRIYSISYTPGKVKPWCVYGLTNGIKQYKSFAPVRNLVKKTLGL